MKRVGLGVVALLAILALALGVRASSTGSESPGADPVPSRGPDLELSGRTLSAAPGGGSGTCAVNSPCGIGTALARAAPGDEVTLAGGSYDALAIDRTPAGASARTPVVLRPAEGAVVSVASLTLRAPGVVVEGLRVTGTVYVHPSAVGATLRRLHVDGSGVFLRASGSRLLDSLVENGTSVDGVQVKDGSDIVVEGNTIRQFNQLTGTTHADCVQLFDVQDVVIRGNVLSDCDNASIIFSPGGGRGIDDVLVEANFVTGCRVRSDACRYGTAIDLRAGYATDVVVRNNTFAGGSVRIEPTPGQVNDRNVFGYLSSCSTAMTNSVVRSWNTGLCARPSALGSQGNRQGEPTFVDGPNLDFHVAEEQRAGITVEQPVDVTYPEWAGTPVDIDGQAFAPTTVGADEPGQGPVVPTTPPSAGPSPSPSPTASPTTSPTASAPSSPTSAEPPAITVAVSAVTDAATDQATLTATVTGGVATAVTFRVSGRLSAPGSSSDGGRTWSLTVDIRSVPPGSYQVGAVAQDGSSRSASSEPVTVVVA
jgi:hypothetical protein